MLVFQCPEAQVHASGEQPDEHVQVKKERRPRSRLMFGDGSDDGYMNLGIACIPQRVEAAGPRSDRTRDRKKDKTEDGDAKDGATQGDEQSLKLLAWELIPEEGEEAYKLNEAENPERGHVVAASDRKEADEGDLHTGEGAQCIPGGVGDVDS